MQCVCALKPISRCVAVAPRRALVPSELAAGRAQAAARAQKQQRSAAQPQSNARKRRNGVGTERHRRAANVTAGGERRASPLVGGSTPDRETECFREWVRGAGGRTYRGGCALTHLGNDMRNGMV